MLVIAIWTIYCHAASKGATGVLFQHVALIVFILHGAQWLNLTCVDLFELQTFLFKGVWVVFCSWANQHSLPMPKARWSLILLITALSLDLVIVVPCFPCVAFLVQVFRLTFRVLFVLTWPTTASSSKSFQFGAVNRLTVFFVLQLDDFHLLVLICVQKRTTAFISSQDIKRDLWLVVDIDFGTMFGLKLLDILEWVLPAWVLDVFTASDMLEQGSGPQLLIFIIIEIVVAILLLGWLINLLLLLTFIHF